MAVSSIRGFCCPGVSSRGEAERWALQAAPNFLRYAAVAGAAIASYTAFTSGFLGMTAVGGVSFLIGLGIFWYVDRHSVPSMVREDSQVKQAQKANFIAQAILTSALLLSGLGFGAAVGYFVSGIRFIITGVQAASGFTVCRGVAHVLFTLGYSVPILKSLWNETFLFRKSSDFLVQTLSASLRDFANQRRNQFYGVSPEALHRRLLEDLGLTLGDGIDVDRLAFLGSLSGEFRGIFRALFIQEVSSLSDKTILKFIDQFPNLLTGDFLAQRLPQEKFERLMIPRFIEAPLNEEKLLMIPEQIMRLEEKVALLERADPNLKEKVERLSTELSQYQQNLLKLRHFLNGLPKQTLPQRYQYLEKTIQEFLLLDEDCTNIDKFVRDMEVKLRPRLQNLQNLCLLQLEDEGNDSEEEDDLSSRALRLAVDLGTIGFSEAHFKELGYRLHIPSGEMAARETQRTCEELIKEKYGLGTREDLEKHGILKPPYTVEEVIDRIDTFCKSKPKPLSAIIQTIFNRALFGTLLAIQVINSPITTTVGFVVGLMSQRVRILLGGANWINMGAIYDPSTELNLNHSYQKNVTALYWRVAAVVWCVLLPSGGFFSGVRHAEAFRSYLPSFRGRMVI